MLFFFFKVQVHLRTSNNIHLTLKRVDAVFRKTLYYKMPLDSKNMSFAIEKISSEVNLPQHKVSKSSRPEIMIRERKKSEALF